MKNFLLSLLTALIFTGFGLSQEYFQTTTNNSYLNKNIRNNGRIIIGDDHSSAPNFQVYKNSNINVPSIFGNSSGILQIAAVGTASSYEPNSNVGDIVFKRLGSSHNLTFYMGSSIPENTPYNGSNNHKFKFASITSPKTMFIYNTGKITIGTEKYDNSDYRLFVKDGIKTEKIKVEVASINGWADYVFKDDYKLLSLDEVHNFIKDHGHLPNLPSAEEVVENGGFELKEMNVKLLEKIEELTLYIIQQNEEIKKLKDIIENL